jgi:hypothetical protein
MLQTSAAIAVTKLPKYLNNIIMVAAKQRNSKSGIGYAIYNTIKSWASGQLPLQICHKFKKKTFTARKSSRNYHVYICKKTAYGKGTMKIYLEMKTMVTITQDAANFSSYKST